MICDLSKAALKKINLYVYGLSLMSVNLLSRANHPI